MYAIRSYYDTKKGHVENALNIPHAKLREQLSKLDANKPTVTYCNKGVTGNAAQNILLNRGFKEVYNLSGGHKFHVGSRINNNESKNKQEVSDNE